MAPVDATGGNLAPLLAKLKSKSEVERNQAAKSLRIYVEQEARENGGEVFNR
jgi:hypothetical protein